MHVGALARSPTASQRPIAISHQPAISKPCFATICHSMMESPRARSNHSSSSGRTPTASEAARSRSRPRSSSSRGCRCRSRPAPLPGEQARPPQRAWSVRRARSLLRGGDEARLRAPRARTTPARARVDPCRRSLLPAPECARASHGRDHDDCREQVGTELLRSRSSQESIWARYSASQRWPADWSASATTRAPRRAANLPWLTGVAALRVPEDLDVAGMPVCGGNVVLSVAVQVGDCDRERREVVGDHGAR